MTGGPMVTKLAVSDDGLIWTRPHHDYLLTPEMEVEQEQEEPRQIGTT